MGKYVPLDLDPEIVNQIDELARKEDRSRAAMIRRLIRDALKRENSLLSEEKQGSTGDC